MCEYFACAYVCAHCMYSAFRSQKRILDSLELKSQVVVSTCVGGELMSQLSSP